MKNLILGAIIGIVATVISQLGFAIFADWRSDLETRAIIKYETWQCEKNGWEKQMTVYCSK